VDFAAPQGLKNLLIDVHADYGDSVRGKRAGGGQADITKAKNTNFVEFHNELLWV
jgi:transcriptional regulator CtsR